MSSDSDHVSPSSDGSDIDDVEIEEEVEELVPIDASEVPALLTGLESTDLDVFIVVRERPSSHVTRLLTNI